MSELTIRDDFGKFLNARKLRRGVEIGTDRAAFAATVLADWECCEEFWCFDPYQPCGEPPHDYPYDRTADLMMAAVRLAPFVPAARIVRECSRKWPPVMWFKPDFVYIDGMHDYENCKADIDAWWPYTERGGIFAGHDYSPATPGVIQAVDEFVKREGLQLNLTAERAFPRSWWVVKP